MFTFSGYELDYFTPMCFHVIEKEKKGTNFQVLKFHKCFNNFVPGPPQDSIESICTGPGI